MNNASASMANVIDNTTLSASTSKHTISNFPDNIMPIFSDTKSSTALANVMNVVSSDVDTNSTIADSSMSTINQVYVPTSIDQLNKDRTVTTPATSDIIDNTTSKMISKTIYPLFFEGGHNYFRE